MPRGHKCTLRAEKIKLVNARSDWFKISIHWTRSYKLLASQIIHLLLTDNVILYNIYILRFQNILFEKIKLLIPCQIHKWYAAPIHGRSADKIRSCVNVIENLKSYQRLCKQYVKVWLDLKRGIQNNFAICKFEYYWLRLLMVPGRSRWKYHNY